MARLAVLGDDIARERSEREYFVVSLRLRCQECGRRWDDFAERWRIYVTADNPPQAITYCTVCARREFED